ncbi:Major Facilitator Superfamily protein [Pseudidiomarina planktonica]|uniref:Major Facilitator Superfamily protein n=1 Tax=Pseudidiomarina planktonica TaxID=1323738 RepID=A0A1Y6FW97_9GAMM|nr:MFS transporter [Pseudidiomarina planktonica]RUO63879.1 MFS transporter [Pseudidiomarina planktonica]SMQ80047.1 Major Facilitator Superfamily protein [Pseudidiomarina planktonica]
MSKQPELSEKLYDVLAEDEDTRVCKDIPESACNDQPQAFLYHLLALTLTKLGDSLVSARLVLPWLLSSLGAPGAFIAALVPLRESLALLPQLFVAQRMRQQPVRKWFWVAGSIGQAAALVLMVMGVLTLTGAALGWMIIGALIFFSLSRGVCSVAIKDVQGKTVSKTRRGRLSGLAAASAGLLSVIVALAVILVPRFFEVSGDALLFVALLGSAACLWAIAAGVYARVPEVPGATSGGGNGIVEALKSLRLVYTDKQFGKFVLTRALLVSSAFAIPYLVVIVERSGDGALTSLGSMMLASGLAGLLAGRFWGKWSDKASHHVMAAAALLSVLVMVAGLLLYMFAAQWLAQGVIAALLIFVAAVAHQGARVGRKTYLIDMADQDNRAQLTAVSNTLIGLVLLSGILLGTLEQLAGVEAVLGFLIVAGLLAALRALRLPQVT